MAITYTEQIAEYGSTAGEVANATQQYVREIRDRFSSVRSKRKKENFE